MSDQRDPENVDKYFQQVFDNAREEYSSDHWKEFYAANSVTLRPRRGLSFYISIFYAVVVPLLLMFTVESGEPDNSIAPVIKESKVATEVSKEELQAPTEENFKTEPEGGNAEKLPASNLTLKEENPGASSLSGSSARESSNPDEINDFVSAEGTDLPTYRSVAPTQDVTPVSRTNYAIELPELEYADYSLPSRSIVLDEMTKKRRTGKRPSLSLELGVLSGLSGGLGEYKDQSPALPMVGLAYEQRLPGRLSLTVGARYARRSGNEELFLSQETLRFTWEVKREYELILGDIDMVDAFADINYQFTNRLRVGMGLYNAFVLQYKTSTRIVTTEFRNDSPMVDVDPVEESAQNKYDPGIRTFLPGASVNLGYALSRRMDFQLRYNRGFTSLHDMSLGNEQMYINELLLSLKYYFEL